MKVLGIVAPLRSEARILTGSTCIGPDPVCLPGGALLKTAGMGGSRAKAAAEQLIAQGAAALLSWGSGGALHPRISPGHLILPKTVVVPEESYLSTDEKWHARLLTCLSKQLYVHTEALVQSSSVLSTTVEKSDFFRSYESVAVDMESGSIAQAAKEANLPFMAIRAIADPLEQEVPVSVLAAIDEGGCLRPFHLMRGLARSPRELFPLIRLGRNFAAARTALITVARLVGDDFLAFSS